MYLLYIPTLYNCTLYSITILEGLNCSHNKIGLIEQSKFRKHFEYYKWLCVYSRERRQCRFLPELLSPIPPPIPGEESVKIIVMRVTQRQHIFQISFYFIISCPKKCPLFLEYSSSVIILLWWWACLGCAGSYSKTVTYLYIIIIYLPTYFELFSASQRNNFTKWGKSFSLWISCRPNLFHRTN